MGIFDSVFGKKEKKEKKALPWITLESVAQLEEIVKKSKNKSQVIYKHSSTCGISRMVLGMFTDSFDMETDVDLYFLTIQNHRDVSNTIADKFEVRHESPQLLVIKNGEVVFHTSHGAISEMDFTKYL
ncbi:MAG TPA: bacillithiol system redox-active protein YtxJ [Muricauda sp.]|uniref:Bacillithiol system redox-active protein YtxJ n=1 Tax=Flagellimonas aurea TaxID=2915619 RepID=A0ABS3G4S5_9FLAO|nr:MULTISPECIES: bacillithiol system redox-active protein YtxJ [Allomuricauda]MAO18055.1 bacillithiol system redox-active protein YtxJ [Allomuricauda sp.]MBO0354283.1 bacillithiol system redox-active protein YtxJ [Allomuricauda aurea]UBZ14072.1 bacillithiol system redox-active protein YtxJ [Allomuricauda aquimarina]HBU77501.1 bacillithiol system redox-active protein YtxJ [Allomuricauda sp.]|tara:strand:+ start:672 stop:1055 length:384 start_codon:yes stop_codon:yes gene_type:complete